MNDSKTVLAIDRREGGGYDIRGTFEGREATVSVKPRRQTLRVLKALCATANLNLAAAGNDGTDAATEDEFVDTVAVAALLLLLYSVGEGDGLRKVLRGKQRSAKAGLN